MKTKDVIDYFGNKTKTAKALNIGKSAISNWGEEVPASRQYQIEVLTSGKLKASKTAA